MVLRTCSDPGAETLRGALFPLWTSLSWLIGLRWTPPADPAAGIMGRLGVRREGVTLFRHPTSRVSGIRGGLQVVARAVGLAREGCGWRAKTRAPPAYCHPVLLPRVAVVRWHLAGERAGPRHGGATFQYWQAKAPSASLSRHWAADHEIRDYDG